MKKLVDIEQKDVFIEMWNNGVSSHKMSDYFNTCYSTIRNTARRFGLTERPASFMRRRYTINESVFDEINTEEKAYFLGLMYSDGYNGENRSTFTLSLVEKDRHILDSFNKFLGSNRPIREFHDGNIKHQKKLILSVSNKHLSRSLAKWGVVQAKSFKIKFPYWLSRELIPHFIRGYFDGDGWGNDKHLGIVATEDFCLSLKHILKDEIDINSYIGLPRKGKNPNTRTWRSGGKRQVCRFYEYIYGGATVFLNRKHIIALQSLNAA